MKINKFAKEKNGMYKVILDNEDILLVHEDLLLKYELLIKKEVSDSLKEKIEKENLIYLAYNLSIKYLSSKARSEKEIVEYLKKKEVDSCIIKECIALLKKNNYINDDIYAKSYINDKISFSNDGPNKIRRSLQELGIKEEYIEKNIKIFDTSTEKEKVKKLIEKNIKSNHNKSAFYLKQKIYNYLISYGYTREIINSELDKIAIKNTEEIQKKEYDKLYKKLSRKFSGQELEYKIREKMYQKGFFRD